MQAEKMWEVSTGKGIKVAVIDTGVDPSTQSLKGRVLPGKDVSGAPGDETRDDTGHGTTMAELIAGSGKRGMLKGLAPDAKIIPIRSNLKGVRGGGRDSTGAEAIRAAADSDAQIINMSFGGAPHPTTKEAIEYAVAKGKLLVASMGNDAEKGNRLNYPAAYQDVVAVGATDKSGRVADFSTRGQQAIIAGPGVGIPGWCDGEMQRYCSEKGTSPAAALVSASAALIWAKHPEWTANQVSRVLIKTAGLKDKDKGPGKGIGFGAVRPRMNLLEGKGDPGDPDISPLTGERTLNTKSKGASSHAKGSDEDDSDKETAPDKVKVADSESEENSNVSPWLAVAAGSVVIILGAGAMMIKRGRRR
ncbi:S8 family serine peptidase [Streptomyces smyrnaeus]|uniref:S8 family serine peptidase n=1 Tax=Streptomyces smyrnaeus TaxID=1387713 RepID=UPI00368EC308